MNNEKIMFLARIWVRYFLFDLDGTLTDSGLGIMNSVRYALNSMGVDVPGLDELRKFIGPPLRRMFMDYCGFDAEKAEECVSKYREYYAYTGIYENVLYPGVKEMLEALADKGKEIILATSKAAFFAKKILEHFGIARYFSFISGAELNGERSGKAELIRYAIENVPGMTAAQSVMIGDRKHDIQGAKTIGLKSVGVLYGYGSDDELTAAGADCMVESVSKLKEVLLRM